MTETIGLLLHQIEKKKLLPPLLTGIMAGFMGLGLMGAGAWLIAWAAHQPPLYTLALGVTCVRACGIFRAVFRYLERYFAHSLAFSAYSSLQQHIYNLAAKTLPLKSGSLAQGVWLERLLHDCALWRDTYVRALLPLSATACLTLCFCAALCSYSLSASTMLALLFLLLLLLPLTFTSAEPPAKAAYRQEILDMLAGRKDLLPAGAASPAISRLNKCAENVQLSDTNRRKPLHCHELYLAIVRHVGFLLVFCLLYLLVPKSITEIELAVWLLLLLTLSQDYAGLYPAVQQLLEAGKTRGHFKAVEARPEEIVTQVENHATNLLKVDNLSFGYQPEIPLFENLSFAITPGQHTALLGESGRGKTTLAYLLARLFQPKEGTIESTCPVAGNLQGCFVFSHSIKENFLRLHPELSEEDMLSCLDCAQLGGLLANLPTGLDTPLGYDGSHLSGGERNRLLTALALASPAPLLILDEPTAGLDKKTASALLTALFARADKQKQTLLVITHDLTMLNKFEKVIRL